MDDLELALAAAEAGAAILAERFGDGVRAHFKGRFDPVTEVDEAAEAAVLEVLRARRPDDALLAEESGGRVGASRTWIVDPLDGTVNFVHGIPQIAVSVALWNGDEPIVGVIVDPLRGERFAAAAGRGATLNDVPIRVSRVDRLEGSVVATGFPYDHGLHADAYARTLGAVLGRVNGIRRFGSAALDLAWVAAGRFDAYFELGVAPWDQAAGILLVREAGGTVTDVDGTPSIPATRLVVASNGLLHEELRRTVADHLPDHLRASPAPGGR